MSDALIWAGLVVLLPIILGLMAGKPEEGFGAAFFLFIVIWWNF